MLHHVSVGVRDVARAATFYDPVLKALGYKRVMDFSPGAIAYGESKDRPEFWIGKPHDQGVPNAGNGTHVGFIARSKGAVNAFHDAALKAGGSNGGEPGPRPDYGFAYYGAFIYDLDGNKIEATLMPPAAKPKAKAKAAKKPARKAKKAPAKKKTKKKSQAPVKADTGCLWPGTDPLYVAYHDEEWGVPEYDSRALYEKLVLDGFQAGLSWITILRKRENFRKAFHNFDPEKIARYGKRDFERLMKNEGIIRSNAKIKAAIEGAQLWLDIEEKEPGGFRELIWKHVNGKPVQNQFQAMKQVPAKTAMSEGLSKELKQRGFKFVGPVIVYAFSQAVGMVNDHMLSCPRQKACAKLAGTKRR